MTLRAKSELSRIPVFTRIDQQQRSVPQLKSEPSTRRQAISTQHPFYRPSPVVIPSLGLFVKYGANVILAEIGTQRMVYQRLHGRMPIPEVFGWTEDGEQRFIYMALIEGDTLQRRWGGMAEEETGCLC